MLDKQLSALQFVGALSAEVIGGGRGHWFYLYRVWTGFRGLRKRRCEIGGRMVLLAKERLHTHCPAVSSGNLNLPQGNWTFLKDPGPSSSTQAALAENLGETMAGMGSTEATPPVCHCSSGSCGHSKHCTTLQTEASSGPCGHSQHCAMLQKTEADSVKPNKTAEVRAP